MRPILQVGMGKWGSNHNRILKGMGYEVIGIDIEENALDLINRNHYEAVICTTSSVAHFPITLACLKNNIPVFCEKPIVIKKEHLQELAKYKDCIFMAGQQLLFDENIKRLATEDIVYMSSIRSGAIPRDEGALLSLAVHDIAVAYYVAHSGAYYVSEAQGNKHEAKFNITDDYFEADIYVRSFSDVRLRHMTFIDRKGHITRLTPDNWNRPDLLEKELKYFMECVESGTQPQVNNLEQSIGVMETLFWVKKMLEAK